jgi:alanine racemase
MAELTINLAAARSNLDRLRYRLAPVSRIMLVAKSDFYGLGLDVASRLEPSVDLFAVNSLAEARRLSQLTATKDIAVLYPPPVGDPLEELVAGCLTDRRIVPTILPTAAMAEQLRARLPGTGFAPLRCHVLVPQPGDRFWSSGDWLTTMDDLLSRRELHILGAFTHFAEAHHQDGRAVDRSVAEFVGAMRRRWPRLPLSVSDSVLSSHGQGLDLGFCRVGLLPLAAVEPEVVTDWGLRTVLTLHARVVNSYRLPRDGRLGYCPRVLKAGTAVAVIDVGFASGLPLEFFRRCEAAVGQRRYPFVETPWMEYSGLLTGDELLPVGAEVELFGCTVSVARQAARAGIPVEALFLHLSRTARGVVDE